MRCRCDTDVSSWCVRRRVLAGGELATLRGSGMLPMAPVRLRGEVWVGDLRGVYHDAIVSRMQAPGGWQEWFCCSCSAVVAVL